MIALIPSRQGPVGGKAQIAAALGLALILLGIVFVERGASAIPDGVPVVFGTGLVIWAGLSGTSATARLLSTAPMRFFGNISYALYLWHWPIVVLAQYALVRHLTVIESVLAFALMVGLSVVSLKFVENPARRKDMPYRRVLFTVLAVSAVLVIAAATMIRGNGWPSRLSDDAAQINAAVGTNYRCGVTEYVALGGARACDLTLAAGDPQSAELVLYGNSHAQMYAPIIRDFARDEGLSALLVPMNRCLPIITANVDARCLALARNRFAAVEALPDASRVIVAFNWEFDPRALVDADGNPVPDVDAALIAGIADLDRRLAQAGKTMLLVGPIPTPGWDVASEVSRARAFGVPLEREEGVATAAFLARHQAVLTVLRAGLGPRLIEPYRALCTAQSCNWVVDDRALFADANHLAEGALPRFAPLFTAALKAERQETP